MPHHDSATRRRAGNLLASGVLLGLLLSGCDAEPAKTNEDSAPLDRPVDPVDTDADRRSDTDPTESPAPSHPAVSGKAGEFRSPQTGLRFTIPRTWREQSLPPMLQGIHEKKYHVMVGERTVEVTFSPSGGGIEANLTRWVGQVQSAPGTSPVRETIEVAGRESQFMELQGTYTGFGKPPQPDSRVVGVAVPGPPTDYYIKMIGPAEAVAELKDDFRDLLKSARR